MSIITCNRYECLRKFKEKATDEDNDFCMIIGKEKDQVIPNSEQCPFYCTSFWDYELDKEITGHENVHWISTDRKDFNYKHYHGLFAGLSQEGEDYQKKKEEWENKHEDCDKIVCPYCDYEFEYGDDDYSYKDGEEEMECPECNKKFNCITEVTYSYSTSKLEEYEENE